MTRPEIFDQFEPHYFTLSCEEVCEINRRLLAGAAEDLTAQMTAKAFIHLANCGDCRRTFLEMAAQKKARMAAYADAKKQNPDHDLIEP